jgi:hypothetical protein
MLHFQLPSYAAMRCIVSCAALILVSLVSQPVNASQYEVNLSLEEGDPEVSGVQSFQGGSAATWTFSSSNPTFTMIPLGDLTFPVRTHTAEYVLSDPKKGVFRFRDGKVTSATRVPLDFISTPGFTTRSVRPTLFVSIPGASFDNASGSGVGFALKDLSLKLSTLVNTQQYMLFTVDWESLMPNQAQVENVSDLIKNFLATKAFAWDVVIMGHSRGGVFAHRLGERLAGNAKISKLHLMLLDPTAATTFGDTYPTMKPAGAYGYLKYDSQPFVPIGALATRSDENITGYSNYGSNNFFATFAPAPEYGHTTYAKDWIDASGIHGLAYALQQVAAVKDNSGGPFAVDGASGNEVVTVRTRTIDADLDAQCSSSSCTMNGFVSFGQLGTVSMTGMIGSDGIDAAIATAGAGASVVIRQDEIALTQSDLFAQHSARINHSGITVYASIINGYGTVQSSLGATSASVSVNILNINVPLISVGPLDALIPGASLFKKKWKLFRGLF